MDNYSFFAMLSRMKYINRWGLMRNTITENIAEHSLLVGVIAHSLAIINNVYFKGNVNPDKIAVMGLFHDAPEIITGDLPTPIKYFAPEIRQSYKTVEEEAIVKLLNSIPNEMKDYYAELLDEDNRSEDYQILLKAADKLSAYIKCIEEKNMGNQDFCKAEYTIYETLKDMKRKEVDFFMEHFMKAYSMTVDEQA